ncbi:MAG: DUF2520 domain-containing protein [Firmicutes bacterium]|nr:DUF2520 domain-containing protein [Bacillota bacterium]
MNKQTNLGFIGAGKVGTSLGKYFSSHNIPISGYFSRTFSSAEYAAQSTSSSAFDSLSSLVRASDIIFVTVPDDLISSVWENLSSLPSNTIKNKILCHCSGSLSSEVFSLSKKNGSEKYGIHTASVHPMLAFSDKNVSCETLSKAYFTIEGEPLALEKIKNILSVTKNKFQIVTAENKIRYHLACCFASNFFVASAAMASQLFSFCGIDSIESLAPLMTENVRNITEKGVADSLTGPIERNDITTVNKHLSVLNDTDKQLYSLLSLKLLSIAQERHPNRSYTDLKNILEEDK